MNKITATCAAIALFITACIIAAGVPGAIADNSAQVIAARAEAAIKLQGARSMQIANDAMEAQLRNARRLQSFTLAIAILATCATCAIAFLYLQSQARYTAMLAQLVQRALQARNGGEQCQ